jgi:uncharacterized protein YbcV (DUF1398 family)
MFTLEQIAEIHDRWGARGSLGSYLSALRDIGIEAYESHIGDGHAEYFGADGQKLVGPASHETFVVADVCNREWFLKYIRQVEDEGAGYVEMSRSLAEHGVEKWSFDTGMSTITYLNKAGDVLLSEKVE